MAATQLRRLDLIDAGTYSIWSARSAASLAMTFGWASQYRSLATDSSTPRSPQALMTRAVEDYRREVLSIQELASWYGQGSDRLQEELGPPHPADEIDEWDDDAPLFPDDEPRSPAL
ncbi:hypothetical protein [Winogradskya consettensis]|nr:hypothetical protein [Actinoplanes consettensis]